MKVVYFLSAMPGTGKSTFIRDNGLEAHTLSLDTMRHVYAGAITDYDGNLVLSNSREDFVFGKFMEALDSRLQLGGTLFIDNLNPDQKSIDSYLDIIKKYDYDYKVIKFPLQHIDFYYMRNQQREQYKQLPKEAIDRNYVTFTAANFNSTTKIVTPEQAVKEIFAKADDLLIDLNQYNKIHFIGDLQGSFYPIKKYFEQEGGLKKNEFYLFVGDSIDRGIENDKCFHFIKKYMEYENVLLLAGNHEKHLYNYSHELYTPPDEFMHNTLPQLIKAGITSEDMKNVYRHLELYSFMQYDDKKIMATHAGLTAVPVYPRLLTADEYMRGFGPYSYDVDGKFEEMNTDNEWFQVHGHRNQHKLGFESYKKSFALEADVEYGGSLPVLRLNREGFNGVYITNSVFNKAKVLSDEKEKDMFAVKTTEHGLSEFLSTKINHIKSGLEIIKELRGNPSIKEQVSANLPYLSAFNFTENVVSDTRSDKDLVVQAQGLFINNQTGEIVARGFDKLFNINEAGIQSAAMENVKLNLKGKISLYEKENGTLGIIGYDSQYNNLVYASKDSIDGSFSGYLKELASKQFSSSELQFMQIYANKHNVNYLFEVNDTANDPHIIKYDQPHLVLIGIVKRDFKFSQLKIEHLESFAANFENLTTKKRFANFTTSDNFEKFYMAVMKESALTTKRQLEGYICEDESLNMIKITLPYYNFWKCMDDFAQDINKGIEKDSAFNIAKKVNTTSLIQDSDKAIAIKFLEYVKELPTNKKEYSIIALRDDFLANNEGLINSINTLPKKPKMKP